MKTILNAQKFGIVIERLAHQLIENNFDLDNTVIIALQPRGVALGDRIYNYLTKTLKIKSIQYGKLDITFYRDDFNTSGQIRIPNATEINCSLDNKTVILIDDVLYTGRTIRSALDAIIDFGRPSKIELMVLIDRRFSRQLPIEANYIGQSIDSITSQKVKVFWQEKDNKDQVILIDNE